jgi:hypothetical protein
LLERAETFSQISRALDLPLRFQPQVQIVRSEFSF